MPSRGQQLKISLLTGLVKDLRGVETFAPAQIDMRNVRLTDAGNAVKRKGYTQWKDTGAEHKILALIPEGDGYAIDANGTIYLLVATVGSIHTDSALTSTPTWSLFDNKLIVANGRKPLLIDGSTVTLLGGDPVSAKFVETISSYTILSGHDETEFWWSVPGNPESYVVNDGAGFANIQKTGTIKYMVEYKERLLFFKEREVEVWNFVGGSTPFVRYAGGKIFQGLGAVNSVVKANDQVYWFGNDGDFYVYEGAGATVITDNMRRRLDEMNHPEDMIGFDIREENVIMWVNHTDGITLLYDYSKGQWLEDARWEGSGWQSLPFQSYMEFNRNQYFGSRGDDGLMYVWSEDSKDDNGLPIRAYRNFKVKLAASDNNTRIHKMALRRKVGVATSTVTNPEIILRWRFDNGVWGNNRHINLGSVGDDDQRIDVHSLGSGRELELELSAMEAVDFLLTDITVTAEELTR